MQKNLAILVLLRFQYLMKITDSAAVVGAVGNISDIDLHVVVFACESHK
jgi:hypothetical protein